MSIQFTNEWCIFDKVIDKKTCNRIKNLGKSKWVDSTVASTKEKIYAGQKDDYKKDTKVRISDVYWTSEQWLYDLIWLYMLEANKKSSWNLDISAAEDMQITRYKKDGFYGWHTDGISDSLSTYDLPQNSFMHGKVRKISMSLILNDNFEGGGFEFCSYRQGKCKNIPVNLKAGSMVFFTTGMEHRVAPVTKGVRYSLVSWFLGAPIK